MPIHYHEKSKTFHLYNQEISYIMHILANGQIGQLYFGKKLHDQPHFTHLLELRKRPMAPCAFEGDLTFSMEHIRQEYPSYGHGDMRHPAYDIELINGSHISEFTYVDHQIQKGKPKLEGLPATYCEQDDEAETLVLHLQDHVAEMDLYLSYTIFAAYGVIARNAKFVSHNKEEIRLHEAMSASIDLPDADYEMLEFTGAWSRERSVQKRKLAHGVQSIYSMRGCSSNNFNPLMILKRQETTEASGEALGFSLVYSGNFLGQIDVDTYDTSRVMMGIHPQNFCWTLTKEESFQTPEMIMVYSDQGLNGISHNFHHLYQTRLARGTWRDRTRPILVNNWEATYFNFDEDKIINIAKTAKNLGIELFVLDDGWFGERNSDEKGLGDWFPNMKKLPNGIQGLAQKITEMGLQFGLWFEPEMVNKDSQLYHEHPDWTLETPHRSSCHGRNQFVLDFSKKEVVDAIYAMMAKVLEGANISYVKWDMNRCMSEVYAQGKDARYQGTVMHRYILGVYDLYERLTSRFPHILFESCASGGARFDPGMLYYAPQCWTSDDTDAIERIKIQYGTSYAYPISSMGAHVSAIPNHQLLRNTPLETRANVAYFGTFGYELDLNALSEAEQTMVKQQISFMKEYRELIQFGDFYRLQSPFEHNTSAWMVVSKDKKCAIVGYYRVLQRVNEGFERIRLQGLDKDMCYHVDLHNYAVYGDELMQYGLITSDASSGENNEKFNGSNGDYQSRLYILKAQ